MDPLVKEYLKTHSFQNLEDEHGVCARPNAKGDKFSLNYDQILVKNGDPIAEQCRGMVIRTKLFNASTYGEVWKQHQVGDVDVIAWPMNRFYNHGQDCSADVDWSDPGLRVYEKLDGTMIVMYWDADDKRWHAATRSVPEADLPVRKDHMQIGDTTFSGLFWTALEKTYDANVGDVYDFESWFDAHFDKSHTYIFELTTPFNRVVVKYDTMKATLLASRHTSSGVEKSIEHIDIPHIDRPLSWSLREPNQLVSFINSADPAKLEGAVVVDSKFNRLKIKNKAWVLSSKAKDLVTCSRRSAILAIIENKIDDVMPLVEPDIRAELESMQVGVREYFKSIDRNFTEFKAGAASDRKSFAFQVMTSGDWTAPYFKLWEGKAPTALQWAQQQAEDKKLSDSSLDVILGKLNLQK